MPPGVFNPPPKVDSGVFRLVRKENYTLPCDEALFFRVVKTAFQQRRKTLRNSLKIFQLPDDLREDVIFGERPEQLSVQQFIDLTLKISLIQFELTDELIEKVESLIEQKNDKELLLLLDEFHYADIAEILRDLDLEEAMYVVKLLDSVKTSEALMELDEDIRIRILKNLSPKEIAEEIEEMDTDDAADIISELSEERQQEVISHIEDEEHAENIVEF